ncbi:MAG: nicotinate-nucleotide--dimethylbenzimidazole phosphoribosyltransferase, partial [Hydrogenophaga sp.]|nr:nicotinate-nucleotide--dimethylbenzimidazole phosphoribosyltransferase [Hydrogenophaga sp.]
MPEPQWPQVEPTDDAELESYLRQQLRPEHLPEHALGRMETLALQLAGIQHASPLIFDQVRLD